MHWWRSNWVEWFSPCILQWDRGNGLNVLWICNGDKTGQMLHCVKFNSSLSFWNGLIRLLIWTRSSLQIRISVKILEPKSKQCRSRWDGLLRAVSSGSTLFAWVLVFVYRVERVKCSRRKRVWKRYPNICKWVEVRVLTSCICEFSPSPSK